MPFMIMYKFADDKKLRTCYVTFEQYKNFKKLPNLEVCSVVKRNQKNLDAYEKEMKDAMDAAVKNDTGHIHKLSENV